MKARGWLCGVLVGMLLLAGCERKGRSKNAELQRAARGGDLQEVQALITRGASVNAKDDRGRTALHWASKKGHVEVVRVLLRCGARIDSLDEEGRTPAILAMENDRTPVVEYLAAQGAAVSLHLAAYLGDSKKVNDSIKGGADVNSRDQDDWTALHCAASRGHRDVVELLITAGADANARARDRVDIWNVGPGGTVLHCAVRGGHRDVAELLIAAGADVNARTGDGARRSRFPDETALHEAVQRGYADLVEALVDHGADLEPRDEDGLTPLNWAARYGLLDMVKLLLAKGADADTKANDDCFHAGTPLGATIEDHIEIAEALIAGGADVNAGDDSGWTPLHVAVMGDYGAAVEAAVPMEWPGWESPEPERDRYHLLCRKVLMDLVKDRVEFLIGHGADVNVKDEAGITPLHCAAYKGYDRVIELLTARAADVNAKTTQASSDKMDWYMRHEGHRLNPRVTPLHMAALTGDVNTIDLLIARGSEADARDESGMTPLFYATRWAVIPVVRRLIASGADINIKSDAGATPLVDALRNGYVWTAEVLIAAGADKVAMRDFPTEPYTDYGLFLKDPLLHKALEAQPWMQREMDSLPAGSAEANHTDYGREWFTLLLDNDADPDERDEKGNTALHAASLRGDEWSARLLIAHSADVNAENANKVTPLHYAASGGYTDFASLLLANGADVNARDDDGDTALHNAALRGYTPVVEVLMAHGADTGVRNSRGRTPLDEATRRRHRDVIQLLTPKDAGNHANETSRSDAR